MTKLPQSLGLAVAGLSENTVIKLVKSMFVSKKCNVWVV
jgi:hypothetical protein